MYSSEKDLKFPTEREESPEMETKMDSQNLPSDESLAEPTRNDKSDACGSESQEHLKPEDGSEVASSKDESEIVKRGFLSDSLEEALEGCNLTQRLQCLALGIACTLTGPTAFQPEDCTYPGPYGRNSAGQGKNGKGKKVSCSGRRWFEKRVCGGSVRGRDTCEKRRYVVG